LSAAVIVRRATEIGRFSVRYRELFGESPSQTLARLPRCIVPIQG
jgi:hypothetical protein